MSYRFDNFDNSLVVDGFENGIADSPHSGIADMRNINIASIPGEAFVNFSTSLASSTAIANISVLSASTVANTITFTGATALEGYMAVTFSTTSISGITASTANIYWLGAVTNQTCSLYSDYEQSSLVTISSNGTGTMNTINLNQPTYGVNDSSNYAWMVDQAGQVWSNKHTTTSGYFTYTGNKVPRSVNTVGNGITTYKAANGTEYVFVFHNSSIDYSPVGTVSWTYQWSPSAGTSAGYAYAPSRVLKSGLATTNKHEAIVAADNRVYYTDGSWVGRFYEITPGTSFDPTNTSTYTFDQNQLLPSSDTAQSIIFLPNNILIGGSKNIVYSWDRFSINKTNAFIFLPENNIAKMVTIKNKTYLFAGTRGRIYVTNGSQADLYKKIPDHVSGTVEPYFAWGGAAYNKNQLYFSVLARDNKQNLIPNYGGVWAINTDNEAIRLSNTLSYTSSTFAASVGYASVLLTKNSTNPAGTGIFSGWTSVGDGTGLWPSGTEYYGFDQGSSNPYTNSAASVDTDLIPIGTFQKPRQLTRIEYKLTKPLVSGESIQVLYRTDFSQNFTSVFTDSTVGNFSNVYDINFNNAQWIQLRAVLNSTASSPSYTRLKHLRMLGLVGPTLAQNQILSI